MSDKPVWSDHLVRKFTRDNSFKVLTGDVGYSTREGSPIPFRPETPFVGHGTIVFQEDNVNYRGGALVTYNSMAPSVLFKNVVPEVWLYNPRSTDLIVAELARRYGVALDPAWFVTQPFDHTDLPKTVELTSIRTHFTIGLDKITVKVNRAEIGLDNLFKEVDLDTPKIPFEVLDQRSNAEFSYKQDFTPDNLALYKEILRYPTGKIDTEIKYADQAVQVVAQLFKERLAWPVQYEKTVDMTADDLCFRGSELLYNGPTKQFVHPVVDPSSPKADTWYDKVLVIRFDPVYSGVQGLAYFHYNDLSS